MGRHTRAAEVEYFTCDICGEECHPFHRTCEVCGRTVCPKAECHHTYPFNICRVCNGLPGYLDEWHGTWETMRQSQAEIAGRWRAASIQTSEHEA